MTSRPASDQRIVHGCIHATMSSRGCTDTQWCTSHACHRSAGTLRDLANPGRPFNSLAWQQTGSDAMDGTMDGSDRWCHVADHVMMSQTRYQPSGQQKVSNGVSSGGSTAGRPVARREVSSGRQPAARQGTRERGTFCFF